jgi:hypothetical protein
MREYSGTCIFFQLLNLHQQQDRHNQLYVGGVASSEFVTLVIAIIYSSTASHACVSSFQL